MPGWFIFSCLACFVVLDISLSTQPSSVILVALDVLEARELDCWCERNVLELVHMIFDNKSYVDPAILLPHVRAPTLTAISSVASFTRFLLVNNEEPLSSHIHSLVPITNCLRTFVSNASVSAMPRDDTVIGNGEDDDGAGPCGGKFKKLLIFSGNDYLGLSSHPTVIKAAVKAAQLHGMGPRGSALICSYTNNHRLLESALADLKKKEDCLLCPAGFAANMALITAVGSVGLLLAEGGKPKRDERVAIFSDALNHASIIDGIRLAEKQGSLVNIARSYWSLYWRLRLTITFLASMLLASANSKCSSEIQMSPWSSTRRNTCIHTPVPYIPCCFNFRNQQHRNHVSMASYISPLIY
ncbi:uncharacterized protein [Coffea arabica]|uniref:Aminotransferase class I/classII large domain-containing protein n=1 Tax=Coffea arabica TaxID=13443 RepID=A0ABM4UF54_COFAR